MAVVPAPAPPPTPEEQLIDLSQALSLDDHVTTPDSDDDETILEEDNRAPSPTKRTTGADEFADADCGPGCAPPNARERARGRFPVLCGPGACARPRAAEVPPPKKPTKLRAQRGCWCSRDSQCGQPGRRQALGANICEHTPIC